MVRAERAFLDELGIDAAGGGRRRIARRHAGARVGGAAIPTTSTRSSRSRARTRCSRRAWPGTRSRATRSWPIPTGRAATTTAPAARRTPGMGVARMVGHITYLSAQSLGDKFGRRLQFADDIRYTLTEPEFEVESYLRHQADSVRQALRRQHLSLHVAGADLLRPRAAVRQRPLLEALRNVSARTLLIAFSSDWLYPPAGSEELAAALRALGKRRRAARHRRAVRPRLLPAGGGAPDADDSDAFSRARRAACVMDESRPLRIRDPPGARRPAARPEHRRARRADLPDDQLRVRGSASRRPRTSTCRSTATPTRGS